MSAIKNVCLVAGLLVLLPEEPVQKGAGPSSWPLMTRAIGRIANVESFCAEKSNFCGAAAYVTGKMQAKVNYSFRLIYNWAEESSSGKPRAIPRDIA